MSIVEELPNTEEVYGTAIAPATPARSVFRNHPRPSVARTVPSVGELRDHVGAMGLAACKIERGEDRRTPVLPWQRKDDWLEARLVPLLWQARFGANAQAIRDSLPLLAAWVAGRPRYRAGLSNNDELVELLTPPFIERLVYEWLGDRCEACRGSGLQELVGRGGRRAPRQYGSTRVRLVSCKRCWGTGWARPDHAARAAHFCITKRCYFALGGPKLFALGHHWLQRLVGRANSPLRRSLGTRTVAR
jgi:hypothetical protein